MLSKIFKISLLGSGAVGKTSLRHRYLGKGYNESYSMTIGADFVVKRVVLDEKDYAVQIWDLAGQDRFKIVREVYYKGTVGALLIFDISRPTTLQRIPVWIEELHDFNNKGQIPMILIGNKSDLRATHGNSVIPIETGMQYAKQLSDWSGFEVPYIETSALDYSNVEEAFTQLMYNVKNAAENS